MLWYGGHTEAKISRRKEVLWYGVIGHGMGLEPAETSFLREILASVWPPCHNNTYITIDCFIVVKYCC